MVRSPAALALLSALMALAVLAGTGRAYNDDRPIYKWSPVWFSRYFRTASAFKRSQPLGEEQQQPQPLGLVAGEQCAPSGRRCSYWGVAMPCCEAGARCLMQHCVLSEDQYLFYQEED